MRAARQSITKGKSAGRAGMQGENQILKVRKRTYLASAGATLFPDRLVAQHGE